MTKPLTKEEREAIITVLIALKEFFFGHQPGDRQKAEVLIDAFEKTPDRMR